MQEQEIMEGIVSTFHLGMHYNDASAEFRRQRLVAKEILVIEGQDMRNAICQHDRDKASIVNLLAGNSFRGD